jgi:hypothetical protein
MALLVVGTGRFRDVARALRLADASMTKKLRKKISDAVPPLRDAVRTHAPEYLPDNYAEVLVPDLRFATRTDTAGAEVRVTVNVTAKRRYLDDLERGRLSHPLWGNRHHWYRQATKPRVVTEPMEGAVDEVRKKIENAVDEVLDEIVRG